jgi:hypothetical protein
MGNWYGFPTPRLWLKDLFIWLAIWCAVVLALWIASTWPEAGELLRHALGF